MADVDGIADRWLRVVLPYTTAAVAGAATICFAALLLPSAAIVLAVSLVVAAIVAPWAAGNAARQAERRIAPRRGELTVASLDLLRGCSELLAFGAAEAGLDRADAADRALSQAEGRSALGRGIAASVTALAAGASVWACLVLGVPAVRSEALPGVALAVLVLTPLAAHEVFGALAPAAQQLPRIRGSASRVQAVLQQPDPVREPASPRPPPAPPYDLRIEGLSARWDAAGPDVLSGIDLSVPAGRRVAIVGPSGAGKTTLAMVLLRFLDPSAGRVTLAGTDITSLDGDSRPEDRRAVRPGRARLRHHPRREPAAGPPRRPPTSRSARRCAAPGCSNGSRACPLAWTRMSASTACDCPAVSASGFPSRACCSPIFPSSSSTSRPSTSTSKPPTS